MLSSSIFAFSALVVVVVAQDPETQFSVAVDAGTTGTRIWAYQWFTSGNDKFKPTLVGSGKTSNPLGDFTSYSQNISAILKYLINEVKSKVPNDKQKQSSIYVFCTGAFRLLPAEIAKGMLNAVRTTLQDASSNPFKFDSARNARILDGSEEATMDWIAINYATGFKADDATSGVLSLSGASTQISFVPGDGTNILNELHTYNSGGQIYSFYARSHLRYGQQYIAILVREKLIANNTGQTILQNPCLLKGESLTVDGKTFNGTGDPAQCSAILDSLMYKALGSTAQCSPGPCSIGTVYQPPVPSTRKFYVTAGFYLSILTLKLGQGSEINIKVNELYTQASDLCAKPLQEIKTQLNQTAANEPFISPSCLTILYMKSLFATGYGLDLNSNPIIAAASVNGLSTDYTLGGILYENALKMSGVVCTGGTTGGVALLTTSSSLIALTLLVIAGHYQLLQ